jgi:2-polyprenyl-6-methoxyphenol hydroxylase-like FAD-dependent oxidoreductase
VSSGDLRVVVVGGSIAGCTLAAELTRAGTKVTVLERSKAVLDDRGAGISSSKAHLDDLKTRDLVDEEIPVVDRTGAKRAFTHRGEDPEGRVVWEQPISTYGLAWGLLYNNLRRRVPDDLYIAGAVVTGIREGRDFVTVNTGGHGEFQADAVVFADGYSSRGRRILFPAVGMEYADYVAWRGIVPERGLTPDRPATEMAMHEKGHCVLYYVPGPDGGRQVGERLLNWVWYMVMPDEELYSLVGPSGGTSLPRRAVRGDVLETLHVRARQLLRSCAADVVAHTPDPFLQVVYDVRVPNHVVGRCALIGDAATIARPHTGSGAIKAAQEAIALAEHLGKGCSLVEALADWNAVVQPKSDELFATGRALGRRMVTESADWSKFGPVEARDWWSEASEGAYVYYADDAVRRP